jgi:hypothetical protein
VTTLESTVSSVLKGCGPAEIQGVLKTLQTNEVVEVSEKKVTYKF